MPCGTDKQRLKAPAAWCQAPPALEGAAWEAKVVRSRPSLRNLKEKIVLEPVCLSLTREPDLKTGSNGESASSLAPEAPLAVGAEIHA